MTESGKETFLVDGFPRNKDNLHGWERQMSSKSNVKGVLFFECADNVEIIRFLCFILILIVNITLFILF